MLYQLTLLRNKHSPEMFAAQNFMKKFGYFPSVAVFLHSFNPWAIAAAFCLFMASPVAHADEASDTATPPKPVSKEINWNAGLALAALAYPSWRGADESRTLILPAPVFSIWTDHSEIGRGGVRAQFPIGRRWLIRTSISGSLPVSSDGSKLRKGLGGLDPTMEAGPAITWVSPSFGNFHWRAEALVRGIFTLSFSEPQWLGFTAQPRVSLFYNSGRIGKDNAVFARIAAGPIWAQKHQHHYFYSVSENDIERAEAKGNFNLGDEPYSARGGYSGSRVNIAGTWIYKRLRLSAYFGYDDLRGATFEDSPLSPEDSYWLAGTFISWRFWGPTRPLYFED